MSANTLHIISVTGFVLAIIFVLAAIVVFFVFDIPAVVGELTGKTAQKQVELLRDKTKKEAMRRHAAEFDYSANNGELMQKEEKGTTILDEETVMLGDETALLDEGTMILSEPTEELKESEKRGNFVEIQNVMEIHSDRRI